MTPKLETEYFESVISKTTRSRTHQYRNYYILTQSGKTFVIPDTVTIQLKEGIPMEVQYSKIFKLDLNISFDENEIKKTIPLTFMVTNISIQLVVFGIAILSIYALTRKKSSDTFQDFTIALSLFFYLGFYLYVLSIKIDLLNK